MSNELKKKKINMTGIIFTIIVTLAFAWAIYQLLALPSEKSKLTGDEMRQNEITAYRQLRAIAAGQEQYIKKDWDGDGKTSYAMFYVHLWRSVTPEGEPIRVNLIPKEVGFAMDISSPIDGYYFVDLRRWRIDRGNKKEFDYEKEWGAAAQPGIYRGTGLLTFLANQTGDIYAAPRMHPEPEYPIDPVKSGWTRIASVEELKEFQKAVPYPAK